MEDRLIRVRGITMSWSGRRRAFVKAGETSMTQRLRTRHRRAATQLSVMRTQLRAGGSMRNLVAGVVRDRVLHSRRVEPSTLLRRLAASESGGLRARRAPRGVHLAAERHVGVTVARGGGGRSAGGRERSCPASTGRTDGEVGGETGGRRGMVQETRAAGSTSTHGGPRAGSVRVLCRCSRIFLTTGGSVMNEMTRICAPQVHSRGSAS
jgi:hypothetical protein